MTSIATSRNVSKAAPAVYMAYLLICAPVVKVQFAEIGTVWKRVAKKKVMDQRTTSKPII